jgi:hypothetical protein
VGKVAGRGQEPERREPERGDGAELDDVACSFAHGQLPNACAGLGGRGAFHTADQLDRHSEQVLRARLVEARATDESWKQDLRRLVYEAARERGERADDALRERDEETATHAIHGRTRGRQTLLL